MELDSTRHRDEREIEELELELLLTAVAQRYGYDFRSYARGSLERRVRNAMEKEGVATLSRLQERVLHDPAAMHRFVETVTVHTTAMFRDPEHYLAIRQHVIPLLRTYPFARIWHAGCATGEEVYSLAILLEEEGLYDRCRIYATDISDLVLDRARKAIYPLHMMRDYTINYQRAGGTREFSSYYTADDKNAVLRQALKRNIVFSQHNLVSDGVFNEFHVVLCRNVTIYFDEPLRNRVHRLIHESLMKFGVLGLGAKESLRDTPFESHYEALAPEVKLWKRTAP